MTDTYSVPLTQLVKEFRLEVAYAATDFEKIRLTVEDVARPGLQLSGYFDHFEPVRLQVMGNVESSYVAKLSPQERATAFDRLFSYKCPAMLIARGIEPDAQCLEMAKKHNVTLLRSQEATSTIISAIITYLKAQLAPRISRHGVLMEVYGEGVLLTHKDGKSIAIRAIGDAVRFTVRDCYDFLLPTTDNFEGERDRSSYSRLVIEYKGTEKINLAVVIEDECEHGYDKVIPMDEWVNI